MLAISAAMRTDTSSAGPVSISTTPRLTVLALGLGAEYR
jgi:hypothetical protein